MHTIILRIGNPVLALVGTTRYSVKNASRKALQNGRRYRSLYLPYAAVTSSETPAGQLKMDTTNLNSTGTERLQ